MKHAVEETLDAHGRSAGKAGPDIGVRRVTPVWTLRQPIHAGCRHGGGAGRGGGDLPAESLGAEDRLHVQTPRRGGTPGAEPKMPEDVLGWVNGLPPGKFNPWPKRLPPEQQADVTGSDRRDDAAWQDQHHGLPTRRRILSCPTPTNVFPRSQNRREWPFARLGSFGARRYSFAAASSVATSNFTIFIIAAIALGCFRISPIFSGTICQHRPNLSVSQPQAMGLPPSSSSSQ